ncbi:abortive infection bacteriophage resistance protein [Arthrobacter sp. JUb115]|nr:abortive infection bacteriophage resistance protein [Arthrobacter sp. JUb115]
MHIDDEATAAQNLQNIGYYRLSGYWYPYRREILGPSPDPKFPLLPRSSIFKPNTNFKNVIHLYEMDRKLKLLVLDGLERIEVAMRFQVGHVLGEGHAYAHCDQTRLSSAFTGVTDVEDPLEREGWLTSEHAKWLSKVRRQENDSKEEFVKHFKSNYGGALPVWVVTEILDFGGISTLYGGLKQNHRDQIAESLGFEVQARGDGTSLASWMKNLNFIRNTCAHHARLWNKNITVQGTELDEIPDLKHASVSRDRIYASLAVIAHILIRSCPEATWRQDVREFIIQSSQVAEPARMGFPDNWEAERIWDPQYRPKVDPVLSQRRKLRNKFECIQSSEVGLLISPHGSRKEANNMVRSLRSQSSLLALQLENGSQAYFPLFQFDPDQKRINPAVEYINQRLEVRKDPWGAAHWWQSPHDSLEGNTPLHSAMNGDLTKSMAQILIPESSVEKPAR